MLQYNVTDDGFGTSLYICDVIPDNHIKTEREKEKLLE